MKMRLWFFLLLFITTSLAFGDKQASTGLPVPVLQDPKTKINFYLESDRRHIAAVSPEGKLLWCCEVTTITPDRDKTCPNWYITDFKLETNPGTGKKMIDVTIWESGYGGGWIDLQTGQYLDSGSVL